MRCDAPECEADRVRAGSQADLERARAGMRNVLDRLIREGTVVARADGTRHSLFPVAIGPAEGAALRSWVIREATVRTIEIGLGYGISALFACEGLLANGDPEARHTVIDPFHETRFASCGLQFLDEAGVADMVEYHAEESQLALPRFLGSSVLLPGESRLGFGRGLHGRNAAPLGGPAHQRQPRHQALRPLHRLLISPCHIDACQEAHRACNAVYHGRTRAPRLRSPEL